MLLVLNLPLVGMWVKLLDVPLYLLLLFIIMFSFLGVYTVNNSVQDLVIMVGFGVIGYLMKRLDIPAAPVNSVDRALADPQVRHRNMVVTAQHPDGDTMTLLGNPIKMSRTSCETITWPPDLGEHTRPVLEELLGMKPDAISALEASGVVHCGGSR
jgi:TctA family transporter